MRNDVFVTVISQKLRRRLIIVIFDSLSAPMKSHDIWAISIDVLNHTLSALNTTRCYLVKPGVNTNPKLGLEGSSLQIYK